MKRLHCRVEAQGPLLVVTIDRPQAMNALPPEGNTELARVFDDFAADANQRVAILTATGDRAFCAGTDLRRHAEGAAAMPLPPSGFGGLTARQHLHKPVIAAVNGPAIGAGFELVLACDLVVAATHAWFSLPEVRVGQVARAGGLVRLPRQLPQKVALHMALTGRRMPMDEAHRWGLVNEVVAREGNVMAVARALAGQLLQGAPRAIEATKHIASLAGNGMPVDQLLAAQDTLATVQAWRATQERTEGARAFVEKRSPRWD